MAEARKADRRDAAGPGTAPRELRGDLRPKRNVLAKAAIGVLGLMLLATAALVRRPRPPEIAANCQTPSFALSSPVKQSRPVAFTMVGPPDKRYAIGVDTATFVNRDGRWVPVPQVGRTADDVVVVAAEAMPQCRRTGAFSLALPLGRHTVTMYELLADGSAVEVQRETVELVHAEDAEPLQEK